MTTSDIIMDLKGIVGKIDRNSNQHSQDCEQHCADNSTVIVEKTEKIISAFENLRDKLLVGQPIKICIDNIKILISETKALTTPDKTLSTIVNEVIYYANLEILKLENQCK